MTTSPSKIADLPGCPTIDRSSGGHRMPDEGLRTILHKERIELHKVSASNPEVAKPEESPESLPLATLVTAGEMDAIRPGDILHVRTYSPLAWAIRRCVGSWGNHDALVVRENGELCIGDASPMRCHTTPLADYDSRLAAGKAKFFVCLPSAVQKIEDEIDGFMAAYWWLHNVKGKPYDFGSYPRLFLKSVFGDLCQAAAGWEWAWYCTESCRDAWRSGAGMDPYQKENPTPRTTEKRILSGELRIVWSPILNPLALLPPSAFPLTSAKYTNPPDAEKGQS